MLQILHCVPKALLEAGVTDLAEVLGGPTLLHLQGEDRPGLFVSTLLHGNETTGWEALRELLNRYQGRLLPRPLSVFIGNVHAAREQLRRLDNQPDYNRIWGQGEGPCWTMTKTVLNEIRGLGPAMCLDIHNTSGRNPVYACVHRLDDSSLQLARSFSPTSVFVVQPPGLLGVACAAIAPSLTLECGKPGNRQVIRQVCEFLDACLRAENPAGPLQPEAQMQLLQPVATVRVPDEISFCFDDQQNCEQVDLCFRAGLDGHNFSTVPDGTAIATIRPGSKARLQVLDAGGCDIAEQYFRTENNNLVTASDVIPSLLTLNSHIIRQDCLCYLMEAVAAPGR